VDSPDNKGGGRSQSLEPSEAWRAGQLKLIQGMTFMRSGFGAGVALIAAVALMSGSASAETATDDLAVSITIENSCSVDVTGNVEFGAKGSLIGDITAEGEITVNCTQDHPYDVALNAGATDGATVAARLLVGTGVNTETIKYALYKDDTYSTVWGETTGEGGDTVSGIGTGVGVAIPVYAKIEQTNTPPADTYSDTVTVTVSY